MRVLLDTTYAARAPNSGTAVYLERLQEALARIDDLDVVAVSNRGRRPPAGGGIGSARNLVADWWWTAELTRMARRVEADLIHHSLPARSRATRLPQVITVHDLAFERFPEHFDPRFRTYAHRVHRAAARSASAVICVSETTAADVQQLWGVAPERIVVAPHGPGQARVGHATEVSARDASQYFLYVGDDEPRKNLSVLLSAYARYRMTADRPLELVLAGAAWRSGPGVRLEHHPAPERLSALYAGAVALVHPSWYEGFGLTALEAMSAGTPVIAARVPALTEICGQAARYADPGDPDSFAAAMGAVAADQPLRAQLQARGRRRAGKFSWDRSARGHVDAYSLALERR